MILAIINIKYKPVYEVKIAENKQGYISSKKEFQKLVKQDILDQKDENIEDISLKEEISYEKKLLKRGIKTDEEKILQNIKEQNIITTYKYYVVSLNNEQKASVSTIEEAIQITDEIKQKYDVNSLELNIQIQEQYTQNLDNINTQNLEVAENEVINEAEKIKEEKEALAIINDVKISVLPVTGRITSRYAERSSLRRSTHTGLDIACTLGTGIKAVSKGTVTFAAYNGSYGNLVKINHGNGVETWYGHCSKIYAKVGQKVNAGDIISAVGSTGNSTGPHLHFEIRINGVTVNPQNYVY